MNEKEELLQMFLKHEQQIRARNPSLFWELIERLTSAEELQTNSPGRNAGVFYMPKLFNFIAT